VDWDAEWARGSCAEARQVRISRPSRGDGGGQAHAGISDAQQREVRTDGLDRCTPWSLSVQGDAIWAHQCSS
jgi:hypothetical protein